MPGIRHGNSAYGFALVRVTRTGYIWCLGLPLTSLQWKKAKDNEDESYTTPLCMDVTVRMHIIYHPGGCQATLNSCFVVALLSAIPAPHNECGGWFWEQRSRFKSLFLSVEREHTKDKEEHKCNCNYKNKSGYLKNFIYWIYLSFFQEAHMINFCSM